MKKSFLAFFFLLVFLTGRADAFELKGLLPTDPYGVFSTFSTESFARGKGAFSVGAEMSVDPDLYRFIAKSAFGLSDRVEVILCAPYNFGRETPDGFEDLALGVKHRFFEEGKYGPSLAYVITASLPSGHEELSTDGRYGAGFVISKRVGPVNGHANVFYIEPGRGSLREEITFLAGLDFAAAHNFKLLAEMMVRKSHFSGKVDTAEGRFGYRIRTADYIYTSFGAGFDFKNRSPETRIMFTVTFLSPKEKVKLRKIYEEE
jgi:hypothetical protein